MWLSLTSAAAADTASAPASGCRTVQWERVEGGSGRPLIFLPALGLPGSSWSKVYGGFAKSHPVYAATFAGAGGAAPCPDATLERMADDLRGLIEAEKLDGCILVGHLLGAEVALRVAGEHPERIAGLFCLPMLVSRAPLPQREAARKQVIAMYLEGSNEMWESLLRMEASRAVANPQLAEELMASFRKADRETYARIVGEMVADRIEPVLSQIRAPVFLLAPVTLPRESPYPETKRMKPGEYARMEVERMRSMYAGIAKCDTMSLRQSRLFPNYEHPDRLAAVLERFLKKIDDPNARWGTTADPSHPARTTPGDTTPANGTPPAGAASP